MQRDKESNSSELYQFFLSSNLEEQSERQLLIYFNNCLILWIRQIVHETLLTEAIDVVFIHFRYAFKKYMNCLSTTHFIQTHNHYKNLSAFLNSVIKYPVLGLANLSYQKTTALFLFR